MRWGGLAGSSAILVFGIDDIHPESDETGYSGKNMGIEVLELLSELVIRHPQLKVTLFVTPDWIYLPQLLGFRFIQKRLAKDHISNRLLTRFLQRKWRIGHFRVDTEEYDDWRALVREMVSTGNFSIGIHGLTHFQDYVWYTREFFNKTVSQNRLKLRAAVDLLKSAEIPFTMGFSPPGWYIDDSLIEALVCEQFCYIAGSFDSERDVSSAIKSQMSGIKHVDLFYPTLLRDKLINIPRNWDIARSPLERALKIIELGGVVGVHAHMFDSYHGDLTGNGITRDHIARLDQVLTVIEDRFGDRVQFATFQEVATSLSSRISNSTL